MSTREGRFVVGGVLVSRGTLWQFKRNRLPQKTATVHFNILILRHLLPICMGIVEGHCGVTLDWGGDWMPVVGYVILAQFLKSIIDFLCSVHISKSSPRRHPRLSCCKATILARNADSLPIPTLSRRPAPAFCHPNGRVLLTHVTSIAEPL